MKRLLVVAAGLVLLVILVLALAPLFFGDAIEARVDAALDRRVDAEVAYGDVGLSLLRHFPHLAVGIDELTVTGVDAFEGDTLAYVGELLLAVDLASAFRMWRRGDPLVVRRVRVDRPYLHARVLEDGRASWDIMKAVSEATQAQGPERPVRVELRRLEVEEGRVVYEDRAAGIDVRIAGLEHTLSGDFATDRFALEARAAADSVTVRQGGIAYLSDAGLHVDAQLDADMTAGRFTFRRNRVAVNELGVAFDGVVESGDEGLDVDLTFAAPDAGLRDILSLVPAVFSTDFENLVAEGVVAVNGHVRGVIGPERVPAFSLNASVVEGRIQYADLGTPITAVGLDLAVVQPGNDLDSAVVDLRRLAFTLGDEPFLASLTVATPISDPEVTASATGTLDLDAAGRALKLEGLETLRGRAVADATVHARRSWLEAEAYDRIDARGQVALSGVVAGGEALRHPTAIDTLLLMLSPQTAELPVFRARIGASDFRGNARLANLLGFGLHGQVLTGRAELRSDYVALDEWKRQDPVGLELIPVPENVDLELDLAIDSMTFGRLAMTGTRGRVHVREERATLDELALAVLGGDLLVSGWYETVAVAPAFEFDLDIADIRIPAAFETLRTVRLLAPAAGHATGAFSADLSLTGPLGEGFGPVLEALTGGGGIRTRGLGLEGMPILDGLAESLHVAALREPAISDFAASIRIDDGRLHVQPFNVRLGPAAVAVSGSNGIDGSIDYDVALELPRRVLGSGASSLIADLQERAGKAGLTLADIETVGVTAGLGGTFRDPRISVDVSSALTAAGSDLASQARIRLQEEAGRQADEARARVEEARSRTSAQARARADSIVAAAEGQAARIRAAADSTARAIRAEADRQAERLVAEASNPVARRAAEVAADRVRQEADRRAAQVVDEADRRADQLVARARTRADDVLRAAGIQPEPDSAGAVEVPDSSS